MRPGLSLGLATAILAGMATPIAAQAPDRGKRWLTGHGLLGESAARF